MSNTYLSITELNQRVAALLERQIPLLWVQGEISNLTRAASGHWYFSLKDNAAQVRAVMFRHKNTLLNWQPREGDAVQAHVTTGLYTARGEFQLTVENMRPAGLGTLFERFLKLKDDLSQAGWFDVAHKKTLPSFVTQIGIITSPQAAALRDVVQTLARRAPHVTLTLYPCLVQGDLAAGQIAQQIQRANQNKNLNVLLLVRGGGSLEDLWAFNERIVAQAIFSSRLPIISGVGHETDNTISDFVADVRAATPTAAAELVSSPSADDWQAQLTQRLMRLKRSMAIVMREQEQRLDKLSMQLLTPAQRVAQQNKHVLQQWARLRQSFRFIAQHHAHRLSQTTQQLNPPAIDVDLQKLQRQQQKLQRSMSYCWNQKQQSAQRAAQSLNQLNPQHVLARGYAYVRSPAGTIIHHANQLQSGDGMSIQFADSRVIATVNHIE